MPAAVLVPVKAFHQAKVRLSPALDDAARVRLARTMAERVVAAAAPLEVAVVCDDPDVREWAEHLGARVVWCPQRGLDGAVADGVAALAADGFDRVVVCHGDLPGATRLGWLADADGVTLVPDRHDDGTNVASVPSASGFTFRYGPGSFRRHCAEALRLGLPLHVVRDAALGWDVDVPGDLDHHSVPLERP